MNLKKYIEIGEEVAGSQANLARILTVDSSTLRKSKTGVQGLPDAICILLAQLIKVNEIEVVAASNLVTEKNPKRREIFEKCLVSLSSVAIAILLLFNSTNSEANSTLHKKNYAQAFDEIYIMSIKELCK